MTVNKNISNCPSSIFRHYKNQLYLLCIVHINSLFYWLNDSVRLDVMMTYSSFNIKKAKTLNSTQTLNKKKKKKHRTDINSLCFRCRDTTIQVEIKVLASSLIWCNTRKRTINKSKNYLIKCKNMFCWIKIKFLFFFFWLFYFVWKFLAWNLALQSASIANTIVIWFIAIVNP